MGRAIHEIQSDGFALLQKLAGALEAENWLGVHRLAIEFDEIAQRGMYHASRERVAEVNQHALGTHQEKEPR